MISRSKQANKKITISKKYKASQYISIQIHILQGRVNLKQYELLYTLPKSVHKIS